MNPVKYLLACGGALMVLALGIVALAIYHDGSDPHAAAAHSFAAHLRALDEGRVDDANALVDITCGKVDPVDVDAARAGLESAGYTFQTAFRVGEVWLNEGGTEAILELETPPNLPLPGVQGMMRVDGEWLLSCG